MKSNRFIFALVITVAFAVVGAGISLFFSKFIDFGDARGMETVPQKSIAANGDKGQGTLAAPPLWGKASFNDGAGMAKLDNFAAFAHLNMPFGNPDMSIEEALDVAVFITTGPRPHFTEKTKPVS